MNELISLAKEHAFVVIGLLFVTVILQNHMHDESLAVRQEMTTEFAAVRQETATEFAAVRQEMRTEFAAIRQDMSKLGERITRIETMVERLPRMESMLEQLLLERQTNSAISDARAPELQ